MPKFTLPEALVCLDGTKVATPEQWRTRRRPEIMELYRSEVYGRPARLLPRVTFRPLDTTPATATAPECRRVRLIFGNGTNAPGATLALYLPARAQRPAPAFLGLIFPGKEAALRPAEAPAQVTARGYALATFYAGDTRPDRNEPPPLPTTITGSMAFTVDSPGRRARRARCSVKSRKAIIFPDALRTS